MANQLPEMKNALRLVDKKGIIYYELLKPKETVNANLYAQKLTQLGEALQKKRPFGNFAT